MMTIDYRGGGGVKNHQNSDDAIYDSSLKVDRLKVPVIFLCSFQLLSLLKFFFKKCSQYNNPIDFCSFYHNILFQSVEAFNFQHGQNPQRPTQPGRENRSQLDTLSNHRLIILFGHPIIFYYRTVYEICDVQLDLGYFIMPCLNPFNYCMIYCVMGHVI